jgi:hypothetical protein
MHCKLPKSQKCTMPNYSDYLASFLRGKVATISTVAFFKNLMFER